MAATANRLIRVRPIRCRCVLSFRTFSSSENESPPSVADDARSESGKKQSFASYVKEVKENLKRSPPQARPTPFRLSTPHDAPPPKPIPSFDELRRNLSEFRSRSAPPPPSSTSGPYVSFQELYKRSVMPNAVDSAAPSSATPVKPSFDAIRNTLRRLRENPASNQGDSSGATGDHQMSLGRLKESLKLSGLESSTATGGINFSLSSLTKEKNTSEDDGIRTALMRSYGYSELGMELKKLRPEKKKGKWFSLHELNERLARFREMEKQKTHGMFGGEIRESLEKLRLSDSEKKRKQTMQRLDHLGMIGSTPKYLLSPPKEHLVAQFFHPDNMSGAEKLKIELKKVREEFKMSESDCGSSRVQVAQLTTKINYLGKVLAKKDKHSRKGLQEMVQRRKKLLKYLRRTDWDSYCLLLSKLGLRDNPDLVKA